MLLINGKEWKQPTGVLISFFDTSGHYKAFSNKIEGTPAKWVITNKKKLGDNLYVRFRFPASYAKIVWEAVEHPDIIETYQTIGTDKNLDQFEEIKLVLKPKEQYELKFQSFLVA